METYIFNIASHYASAIVNNDYTGLDDNEEKELNGFLDYLQREYGNNYLIWNDAEADYNRCDVSNLMGDCLQFTLEVQK